MIEGFEKVTSELKEQELELANDLIKHFLTKTKNNKAKASDIVKGVNCHYNLSFKFTEVRLRKIINHYRSNSIIPIISDSEGYFVSYEKEDLEKVIKSLDQRSNSIKRCSSGLKKFLDNV